jgi:hypothetical protein
MWLPVAFVIAWSSAIATSAAPKSPHRAPDQGLFVVRLGRVAGSGGAAEAGEQKHVAGEEHEAPLVRGLEEQHPHGWADVRGRRRDRHASGSRTTGRASSNQRRNCSSGSSARSARRSSATTPSLLDTVNP